jgi:uncharacterized pyridoxal phosphate-containing UPF0001 family protein
MPQTQGWCVLPKGFVLYRDISFLFLKIITFLDSNFSKQRERKKCLESEHRSVEQLQNLPLEWHFIGNIQSNKTKLIAENAITLLSKKDDAFFPLHQKHNQQKVIFVGIGINNKNSFAQKMKLEYNADLFFMDYGNKNKESIKAMLDSIKKSGKKVVIGIHQVNRAPAKNFSMSNESVEFVKKLQQQTTLMSK